ncbi:Hypothetical protein CINCED_3A017258 [Cinara cedri]|uniref:Uncharacterized protein n=1 Tax=Cinara cedri TaxID=506608 RepID=A0A5E4NPA4_9HEMI|nr:Hypothetical protein CINCED_3A017258 [Cinara cedri]
MQNSQDNNEINPRQISKSAKRANRRKVLSREYKARSILESQPNATHSKSLDRTANRLYKKARNEFRIGLSLPSEQKTTSTQQISKDAKSQFKKAERILEHAFAIQKAAEITNTVGYQYVPERPNTNVEKYNNQRICLVSLLMDSKRLPAKILFPRKQSHL